MEWWGPAGSNLFTRPDRFVQTSYNSEVGVGMNTIFITHRHPQVQPLSLPSPVSIEDLIFHWIEIVYMSDLDLKYQEIKLRMEG